MQFENIPLELREWPNWVVWRYENVGREKPTKVPYSAKTGRKAATDDAQTWCSFVGAVSIYQANPTYWSGIGFVFSGRDPYCGIDLDASDDPYVRDGQKKIFERFNSYSERSPSGGGLHIIIQASVPRGRKNPEKATEIYSLGRFFTMTGDVFHNAPVAKRQELAIELWEALDPSGGEHDSDIDPSYLFEPATEIDQDIM
jgi:primase-polymerase (primpol)-like protein